MAARDIVPVTGARFEETLSVMQNPVNGWPVDRCPNFIGKLATRRVK